MARRGPRARSRRAVTVALGALIAALWSSAAAPLGHAQPADPPEISRARDLYASAEAAIKDGRYDDAIRDYGAAYELSRDPVLFFKIGRANERAGKCQVAVSYYARYLRDGEPSEQFIAATRERIAACGGDVPGSAAKLEPRPAPTTGDTEGSAGVPPIPAGSGSAATATTGTGAATGSAALAPTRTLTPSNTDKAAWILSGGAIAMITLGGVLAYASSSSENDIRDLYVGFAGLPATFDAQTQKKYNDLVDQGHRYQHLSWTAFGLAGAAAVGAAILFVIGDRAEPARHAQVTPLVTTNSAGVAVAF